MSGPINDRLLEVLRWIADGCPAGKWADNDFMYKTSAMALNSRGLVLVQGRGRNWSATVTVTESGAYYLEHGTYPPSNTPPTPNLPRARNLTWNPSTLTSALAHPRHAIRRRCRSRSSDPTERSLSQTRRSRFAPTFAACCTPAEFIKFVPAGYELRFTGRNHALRNSLRGGGRRRN